MKKNVADLLTDDKKSAWDSVVENAPLIMAVFSNFIVIVADVRVYDVMYRLTGSWWKALLSSLACAIPFIIWEIAWQYNHTTEGWRFASLSMAGLAFATSLFLGVADYLQFTGAWTDWLLGGVVVATGVHGVVGLLYYYNDPDVARRRHKAQAEAMMLDQQENTAVTRGLLESGRTLLGLIEELEKQYSPDEVRRVLSIVSGKKPDKPKSRPANNSPKMELARQFNSETDGKGNNHPQKGQ